MILVRAQNKCNCSFAILRYTIMLFFFCSGTINGRVLLLWHHSGQTLVHRQEVGLDHDAFPTFLFPLAAEYRL